MTENTLVGNAAEQKPPERAPVILTVNDQERATLVELSHHLTADLRTQPEWACRQARALAHQLPNRIFDTMVRFADEGSEAGILVLRGLAVGAVPRTPLTNEDGLGMTAGLARQVVILAHQLGEMIKYEAEGHGFLLQDMVPNPELCNSQQSQGSRVELEEHTEQCFSSVRPDYLVLGCLRGDPAARTYVFTARDIVSRLTLTEEAMLRRNLWTTTIDESFQPFMDDPDQVRGPWPIIAGPLDDPTVLIDQDLMVGITRPAQKLLDKVHQLYLVHRRQHVLQPGDVLFLDNLRAMHGRSPFRPRFDGGDRFIIRGFIVRDRRRLGYALTSDHRTVGARFS